MSNSSHRQVSYSQLCKRAVEQSTGILYKNFRNHMSNKKKLLGELVMPLIISAIYAVAENNKSSTDGNSLILVVVMTMLLKIYIGLIGISAVRELVTLFIVERTEQYRQYQFIFGLSHQIHTLSNLFYMGLYLSATILPLYLTISYFHLELIYIFYFGSFVISTCCLALALTAFFNDHKIALEIIGMLFSLSAFLVFFYDEQTEGYTLVQYLAMIMPNSSFTIAILYKDTSASLYSLFAVKLYMIVYSLVEFPEFFWQRIARCWRFLSRFIPCLDQQPTNLTQDFELNDVVNSELEQNSLGYSQKQVVIRTEALVKTYEVNNINVNALNGVNLKIHKSEIFGLLGRNGAGKTSLVDILTNISKPTSGTYRIVNQSETIGICYQKEILYEAMTVQEHLYVYSHIKPLKFESNEARKQHVEQIIQMLNIDSERQKQVKELSGGNKRKLSIAIAIIGKPDILIFDEPTSGLDPLSRMHVWEIFQSLRSMQSTIILTTHHLDEAQKLADWICVIEKGSVIVENTSQYIKQKYGKGYHLTIVHKNEQIKFQYSDIEKYKNIIEKCQLKSKQLQHIKNELNFLIKPPSKTMNSRQFEQNFIKIIEVLEEDSTVSLNFHSNTLEESFIAILKDSADSSGDSLGEQILPNRQNPSQHTYGSCQAVSYRLLGVYLKNLYFHKSIFLQSIIIYNINILIILIAFFFNRFVAGYISDNGEVDHKVSPNSNSSINLVQGYLIMATAFIHAPVYERQKKIRALLNARGLSSLLYWFGNFLFDFSIFNLNLLLLNFFFAPQTVHELGWSRLFELGVAMILFTYCCSFLFQKVKTASTWFSLINILFGMIILPLVIFGKKTFLRHFQFVKYFYPFYDISVEVFFQSNSPNAQLAEVIDVQKPEGSTTFISIIIYLTILICLQLRIIERIKNAFQTFPEETTIQESIKLDKIQKKYGKIEALKGVSFEANEERLALLGHNGAGKSTTFGLLSAQLTQNQGNLYVQKALLKSHQKILKSTGICYQEDSLWEGVLVQEILKVFSYIVPIQGSDNEVKWLFDSLEYDTNNNYKRFKNLSGGNKRKLCMMIALYGDPLNRLLDECSTGLDPSSRLAMIETIKASRRGTTIFTTHSMSEAENLCTRTVIMGKGKVLQFDYISKLKNRYFSCCWLDLKVLEGEEEQEMKELVRQHLIFKGTEEILSERGYLRIEITKKQVKIGQILRRVQQLKLKRIIESFSIVEPRLEDVYIKATREETGDDIRQGRHARDHGNQPEIVYN